MGGNNIRVNNLDKQLTPAEGATDQAVTISTSAIGITAALVVGNRTSHFMVTIDGADVRMRFDGTDPTATVGAFWPNKEMRIMKKETLLAAKFIRDAAVDANMHVSEMVGY